MENNETQAVKQKTPLTKQEKVRRGLLIGISAAVILVIIFGLIFGSPYSIKKNDYASFEIMVTEHYDRPTVLLMGKKSCPYCQKVYPWMSELKDEYEDRVNFYYTDVTGSAEGRELKRKYPPKSGVGIDGVPCIYLLRASTKAVPYPNRATFKTGVGTASDAIQGREQIEALILDLIEEAEELKAGV